MTSISETSPYNIEFGIGALRRAVAKATAGQRVQPTLIKVLADMIGPDRRRTASWCGIDRRTGLRGR